MDDDYDDFTIVSDPSLQTPVDKLRRDIKSAAAYLGTAEARFLVDAYYLIQDDRKRSFAQRRELADNKEPNEVIAWFEKQNVTLEKQIKSALDTYTRSHLMGSWMRQIYGIGPVLAAGFLTHIYMGMWCEFCRGRSPEQCAERQKDKKYNTTPHKFTPVESCPTIGHIWQHAGIAGDGQKPWEKGSRRPFNAKLKTLCWKAGQSFMKFSNQPDCYYGKIYRERKGYELMNSTAGTLATQAATRVSTVGKGTEAYGYYAKGELPPGHLDARARRYAVKRFLGDLHNEWYRREFGREPPKPYVVEHMGHVHVKNPPV